MPSGPKVINVELRPDRKLIDTKFESYKLSLSPLPSYQTRIECGIRIAPVGEDHLLYEKIRCLTLHNYLAVDQWDYDSVYFIDAHCHIRRVSVTMESQLRLSEKLFSLGSEVIDSKLQLPPSIMYPSSEICVSTDGCGQMFVLSTGNRGDNKSTKWTVLYKDKSDTPSILLTAVLRPEQNLLDLLLLRFEVSSSDEDAKETVGIDWVSLEKSEEKNEYNFAGIKCFKGKSVPTYVCLSSDCTELYLASTHPFTYVPGWTAEEEVEIEDDGETKEATSPPSLYKWRQTADDITVLIPLPEKTTKQSIVYSLNKSKIHVGFRQQDQGVTTILDGNLYLEADPESSNWSINDRKLEVVIQKRVEGRTWPVVVDGDDRGVMEIDPEEAKRVSERLSHLTSETMQGDKAEGVLFNSGEIEDCDSYYDSEAALVKFDSLSDSFTHIADISSLKWLFNFATGPNEPTCLVLRHDVDAIVWQPTPVDRSKGANRIVWRHITTFNALGYVHASKTNVKFGASSPDSSYAALCECQRRVFVYRQPAALASPLRNRSSGEVVGKVSLQQVATLPHGDDIYGFACTNERMFVLTASQLITFKIATDEGA